MPAYTNTIPFWIAGTVAIVLLFVALAWVSKDRAGRVLAVTVLTVAVSFWVIFPFVTGVERVIAHDMQWSCRDPSDEFPGADHIRLTFKSHPDHFIGIYSRDLGDYLETLPSKDVRVRFRVTQDFGKARGFSAVQIGDRRQWDAQWSYAGSDGAKDSPWP